MAGNAFQAPVDIGNRAAQRVGARRMTAFTDNSKTASEISFCYDMLRQAELRRNVWRFATRRSVLRAVGTDLQAYDSTLTYASGAYVSENSINYTSLVANNTGNDPSTDNGTNWAVFLGNTTLQITFGAYAALTTYNQGQVVTGSDGRLYMATVGSNTGHDPTTTTGYWTLYFGPTTATQYDSTQTYQFGELVFYTINTNVYLTLSNGNTNDPTASNSGWVAQTCTVAPIFFPWPAGTGPTNETETKNVFVLPSGYLRRAPQEPSAGRTSMLGFPSNLPINDWVFEGPFLLSRDNGPITFRFIADVIDVTQMDAMFCEALACRIGVEVCETLTQSTAKVQVCEALYKKFMYEARAVDSVEQESTEPPLDDYIMTRV